MSTDIKGIVQSFMKNVNEKATNPFIGALAISWIIRNWDLVFGMIYFDSNMNQHSRLEFIRSYISEDINYWYLLWSPLFFSLLFIAGIPLFNYLALTINLFYQRKIKPKIYGIDDPNVVMKERFDDLNETLELVKEELEETNELYNERVREYKSLQIKIQSRERENNDQKNAITEKENELHAKEKEISELNSTTVSNAEEMKKLERTKKKLIKERNDAQSHLEEANKSLLQLQNVPKLEIGGILEGYWNFEYEYIDGNNDGGDDVVHFQNDNKWMVGKTHMFNVSMVTYNKSKDEIKFRIKNLDNTKWAVIELYSLGNGSYHGKEYTHDDRIAEVKFTPKTGGKKVRVIDLELDSKNPKMEKISFKDGESEMLISFNPSKAIPPFFTLELMHLNGLSKSIPISKERLQVIKEYQFFTLSLSGDQPSIAVNVKIS